MYASHAAVSTDRHPRLSGDRGRRPVEDDHGRASNHNGAGGLAEESRPDHAATQDVAGLMQEIDGLRRRLLTQPVIEQAKGVLVGIYGIDADTAFAVLVRWSQHTNTKLHLLALDLVDAASKSSGQPYTGLHRLIDQMPDSGLTPVAGRSR